MQEITVEQASKKVTEESLKQLIGSCGDTKTLRAAWIRHTGSTWQNLKSTPVLLGCFDVLSGYGVAKKSSAALGRLIKKGHQTYPVRKSDTVDKVVFDVVKVTDAWMGAESADEVRKRLYSSLELYRDACVTLLAFDFSFTAQDGLLKAVLNELQSLRASQDWQHITFVFLVDSSKPELGFQSGGLTLFQCYEVQSLSDSFIYKSKKTMYSAGELMTDEDA